MFKRDGWWGGGNKKQEQVFEICDFPSYYVTYKQIKDDIDKVILDVNEFYSKEHSGQIFDRIDENGKFIYEPHVWEPKNPSEDELNELKEYMLQFVEGVDYQFKPLVYLKYEYYYPILNKLYKLFKK